MGGSNQSSSSACSPQNFSGSLRGRFVHFAVFFERIDAGAFAEFFRRGNGFFFENVRIEFLHDGDSSVVFVRRRTGIMDEPRPDRGGAPFGRPYVIEAEGFGQGGDSRKEDRARRRCAVCW